MSAFLLNNAGELLLEINDTISFDGSLCLEVNPEYSEAILRNRDEKINIGYVHPEVLLFLKRNRYLCVVKCSSKFYALNSKLANVVFVD